MTSQHNLVEMQSGMHVKNLVYVCSPTGKGMSNTSVSVKDDETTTCYGNSEVKVKQTWQFIETSKFLATHPQIFQDIARTITESSLTVPTKAPHIPSSPLQHSTFIVQLKQNQTE